MDMAGHNVLHIYPYIYIACAAMELDLQRAGHLAHEVLMDVTR